VGEKCSVRGGGCQVVLVGDLPPETSAGLYTADSLLPAERPVLGLLPHEPHHLADQPLDLLARRIGKPCLGQRVLAVAAVRVQESPQKPDHGDSLELRLPLRLRDVALRLHQRLEPVRIAQRLRGERGDRLTEADVRLRERMRSLLGAQRAKEDRADDRPFPPDRHDDDRADVPRRERCLDALQHRFVRRVGDEHRLPRLEGALELRVAIEVYDEVADRRVLVARYQAYLVLLRREEDRAAVETEGLAKLSRDALEDVDEMERGGDLLEDVDDGGQLVALAVQLDDARAKGGELVSGRVRRNALERALEGALQGAQLAALRLGAVRAGRLERRARG
jgi:hypothetical protein